MDSKGTKAMMNILRPGNRGKPACVGQTPEVQLLHKYLACTPVAGRRISGFPESTVCDCITANSILAICMSIDKRVKCI